MQMTIEAKDLKVGDEMPWLHQPWRPGVPIIGIARNPLIVTLENGTQLRLRPNSKVTITRPSPEVPDAH